MPKVASPKRSIFRLLMMIWPISIQIYGIEANCAEQIQITESPISQRIPQPIITAIFKDRDEFLWIGTQHGLYRFDGVTLTEYSSSQDGNQKIPASGIKGIVEDSNGRIIVATYGGGLLIWDTLGKFFRQAIEGDIGNHLYITDLIGSRNDRFWVVSEDSLYPFESGFLGEVYSFTKKSDSAKRSAISAISSDRDDNIYVAFGKDIYKVSSLSDSIEKIFPGETIGIIDGQITAIATDHAGYIYAGTEIGELLSIETTSNSLKSKARIARGSTTSVIALLFHNDILWIGTNNGLTYSDSTLSSIKTYSDKNSGLSNNHILTLAAEGDFLWIGTYQGLNLLSFPSFEKFNSQNSGIFNDVLAFAEDRQNRLWVGTFNGLYLLDEKEGFHRYYQHLFSLDDIVDQRIMTLASKGDELWLGFQQNGLQIVNTTSLEVRTPPIPEIDKLEVTKIVHTQNGRTWIATFNQGLFLIENGTTISFLKSGLLPIRSITILFELKSGQIVASSEEEIYLFEKDTNILEPLKFQFHSDITSPLILSISQHRNGDLWIGTKERGLFIWREKDQQAASHRLVQTEASKSGFLSTVYEIQFDEDENAWCSTKAGIVKLDKNANIIARFTTADGLQGQDFNFGASFKDSLGRIYFGGSNGYNRFYPGDVHIRNEAPRMSMLNIGISMDSQIEYFDALGLDQIQLTHKDYFVQFNFSVLDYLDPEKNRYRYLLEGFDPDWIDNGTRYSATYTSLPPGDYTLRVQGANSAGIWNREGLSLAIEVLPPPWKTWWAYCAYTLLAIFFAWLGKRAYDSYVIERRAREMAFEMIAAEERADDEMQEQLEIHDDLVKSVYRHNVSTLSLVSDFIAIKGSYLADSTTQATTASSIRRVSALALLEDCLYYQNEVLLADLNQYTDIILSGCCRSDYSTATFPS